MSRSAHRSSSQTTDRPIRSRLQPRTSPPTSLLHYSRRYPFRIGQKCSASSLRGSKRCSDYLLPYPTLQTRQCTVRRSFGHILPRLAAARDHCRVMSRLRTSSECHALWDHIETGSAVRHHCCTYTIRRVATRWKGGPTERCGCQPEANG